MSRRPFLPFNSHRRSQGFTLIEILLSLGLAALVLVALATAVDVHLRCLQIGRTNAEEAQLARALLFRIEDDLRNAAVSNPVDSTKIPPSASNGSSGTSGTTAGGGSSTSTGDISFEEVDTEDEYAIGLYGETDWMQVDVRRTPRLDQYHYETLPSGSETLPDRVSGVKTVYYALSEDTGTAPTGGEYRGGLIRREIDQALTRWAEETGTLSSADLELVPIAPEVTDLEFLYCDGTEWVDNWDSTEMSGLPTAVHISLAIMPREQFNRFTQSWSRSSVETEENVNFIYSLTVALPVAKGDMSDQEESAGEASADSGEAGSSEGGAGSAGTTSGASGAGGTGSGGSGGGVTNLGGGGSTSGGSASGGSASGGSTSGGTSGGGSSGGQGSSGGGSSGGLPTGSGSGARNPFGGGGGGGGGGAPFGGR